MATTVLLTGFGPFPGAPFNPTEPLVNELAHRRLPLGNVRRIGHIFSVSYETIDQELLPLLERERPDALVMFGLAVRATRMRIETRARNALLCSLPDASGSVPASAIIAADAPTELPLPAPAQKLLAAARETGVPIATSRNAGSYLCNYLCWRAAEAARSGMPQLATFVHVPAVPRSAATHSSRTSLSLNDLIKAGEAIVQAAAAAAR